jgi:hypothetical protein
LAERAIFKPQRDLRESKSTESEIYLLHSLSAGAQHRTHTANILFQNLFSYQEQSPQRSAHICCVLWGRIRWSLHRDLTSSPSFLLPINLPSVCVCAAPLRVYPACVCVCTSRGGRCWGGERERERARGSHPWPLCARSDADHPETATAHSANDISHCC